jgi:hypothetical protein
MASGSLQTAELRDAAWREKGLAKLFQEREKGSNGEWWRGEFNYELL